jgi:hypothetical protein
LRDSPTEGVLWEGAPGSGLDSFQPDDAGRRSALQFTRALEEIAGALEAQADAEREAATRAGLARAARRTVREDAEREARLSAVIAETQERHRRMLAGWPV